MGHSGSSWAETAPVLAPRILGELPRDPGIFTQGLFFHRGRLYTSAGLRGQSRLVVTKPRTGETVAVHRLAPALFAEGADLCGDEVIQLTWTSRRALRYDPDSLRGLGEFAYDGQGWGIACDNGNMVTSDGSATLTFRDPASFAPRRWVEVTDAGRAIPWLNELEWVDGQLLANIWRSRRIAVIDPATGVVRLWLDLSEAVRRDGGNGKEDVLNGIAWDDARRQLYVTGKRWKHLYRIEWPEPREP